jgi:hypothetical protein
LSFFHQGVVVVVMFAAESILVVFSSYNVLPSIKKIYTACTVLYKLTPENTLITQKTLCRKYLLLQSINGIMNKI